MIDSAQWWLYVQTSFRQLSEIYRAEEFMVPRDAHAQNEKEPPFPLFSHSCPHFLLTLPEPQGCPLLSGDTLEPHIFCQRRLTAASLCNPPVESMECVMSYMGSVQIPQGQGWVGNGVSGGWTMPSAVTLQKNVLSECSKHLSSSHQDQ